MMRSKVQTRLSAFSVALSLSLLAVAVVGKEEEDEQRRLYESDGDKNCLADEGCRFVLGISCIVFVPLLILWNELRYVKLETLYATAQRFVRDMDMGPRGDVDQKFVCFSGELQGATMLQDEIVPEITVKEAVLLAREIEILQYVEIQKNKKWRLEKKWCKIPQKDPPQFKETKNPVGNWEILSDRNRLVNTGSKLNGEPIRFGDNCVVTRAPCPTIGSFAIPTALMNEVFLGSRHVHRLGELQLIKESQGIWQLVSLEAFSDQGTVSVQGMPFDTSCYKQGGFVYDGGEEEVGTIRMKWKYAAPQNLTIAAEAVAPGRPCELGYGVDATSNTQEDGVMMRMVREDLAEDLCCCCLGGGREEYDPIVNIEAVPSKQWTLTPFSVTTKRWLPPYDRKVLGKLWLYAPGLLDSQELFLKANRSNMRCLWKVRGLAYILLLVGWLMAFGPIVNAVSGVPVLRGLVSLSFAIVAFVLATTCCLSCTLVSRVTARPIQSIMIISALWAAVLFFLHLQDKTGE